jgi:hypothetical protein
MRPNAAALLLLASLTGTARGQTTRASVDEPAPDAAWPVGGLSLQPPSGPVITRWERPDLGAGELRACSFRRPLCVHGTRATPPHVVLATLAAGERAWGVLTGALRLPAPDGDPGTGAFDVYLVADAPGVAMAALDLRDPRAVLDRASAFAVVDATLPEGCARDAAVARAVARGAVWRASPATDLATARAESAYLARLMEPCAMALPDGVDRFQAHPERALTDTWAEERPLEGEAFDRGAALFYWWLDVSFGAEPGAVVRALWALTPTSTPAGSFRWMGRPHGFDVLQASFKGVLGTGSTLDDLLLEFAVARAFVGDADDGQHLPESRGLGAAGRVRHEWDIAWPTTPRRLASGAGVAPTGATFIGIDHGGAPPGSRLRVEASWEEHAKMRWAVVKLDAAGRATVMLPIPSRERGTDAQMTVADLDDVARILLVGTNTGDPTYPFDPNDEVWEPHGWTVTFAGE